MKQWALAGLILAMTAAGCGGGGGGGGGTAGGRIAPSTPVAITTATVPDGAVGAPYAVTIAAKDGIVTRYSWAVIQGTLPSGLALGQSGVPSVQLAGTPATAGTFNFTVLVTDGGGFTDIQSYSIEIAAALAVTTTTLPSAVQGIAYNQAIDATAGSGAGYQWRVSAGSLPPGVSIAPTGTPATVLSGTPTAAGAFAFTVEVKDAIGSVATQALSLSVAAPVSIVTTTLPTGTAQQSYSATIATAGGTGVNYLWTRTSGALPNGVVFAARGTPSTPLSGTPTQAGAFTFTVQVQDSSGATAQQAYTLDVNPVMAIATASPLPVAVQGAPYAATVTASGGSGAGYTWTVASGALPAGLTLAGAGTPTTTISGTPTAAGAFAFTIRMTDSNGGAIEKAFTATVNPALDITAGPLPAATQGVPYAARIFATEGSRKGYVWSLDSGALPAGMAITHAGTPAARLGGAPTVTGTASFTMRVQDDAGNVATEAFSITVAPAPSALEILTRTIPFATSGSAASFALEARGGAGSNVWSVAGGGAPAPGLSLANDGTITGTPAGTGVFFFTAQVQDSTSATASRELAIEVKGPHRWVAYLADQRTNDVQEMFVADMNAATPAGIPVKTSWASFADTDFGVDFQKLSPDGSKLAFRADLNVDGMTEIFVVDLSSGTPGAVQNASGTPVSATADATDFEFSPDSKKLLVRGDLDTDGTNEIFVVDVSGPTPGPRQRVNATAPFFGYFSSSDFQVAFSPDGQKLAYIAEQNQDNVFELFVVDLSGPTPGAPLQVSRPLPNPTTSANDDVNAVWWAGNDALVFMAEQDTTGIDELYWADVSGALPGAPVKLNPTAAGGELTSSARVSVAPDGKRVAFFGAFTTAGRDELYLVDVSGAAPAAALRLNVPYTLGFESIASLAWAPDASRIAYTADENVTGENELFVIDLLGSETGGAQIVASGKVAGFAWAPSSRKLAYRDTATDTNLFVVDASAALPGAPQQVNTALAAGGDVASFKFAPDSASIAYVADQATDGKDELWVVSVAGAPGSPLRINNAGVAASDVKGGMYGWSRDATRLYFANDPTDELVELFIASIASPTPNAKVSGTMASGGDVLAVDLPE